MPETHDLVVVGLGVGGIAIATQAAEHGLDVLAVEEGLVGGECPYWGCIPSKAMTRAAQVIGEVSRAPTLVGPTETVPKWPVLADRVAEVSEKWDDTVPASRLQQAGVTLIREHARIVGPGEIEVANRRISGRRGLVIATGTSPAIPPIAGLAESGFWTNHEAVETTDLPESLVILGGGAVGLELGQTFRRFGTRVTIIEAQPNVLASEEPENAEAMGDVLRRDGIDVRTTTTIDSVRHSDGKISIQLDDGTQLTAERLLVAVGRRPELGVLGVGCLGVEEDASSIPTDDRLRVTERTWAVGDVTGHGAFTHVAYYQAQIAAADILEIDHPPADYSAVPRVVYTDPEVGGVGVTEAQARARGMDVSVGILPTSESDRGWLYGPGADQGFIKVVSDNATGTVIGGSALGPAAGEVIAALSIAIRARVSVTDLLEVIYPYPTFTRALRGAIRRLS